MLGFLIGTACLIGLFKVVRGGGGWRRSWRSAMLRRVFEQLDTTPGQEKVIFAAIDSLEQAFARAGEQVRSSHGAAADSLRGEHFNEAAVGEAFAKNSAALDELQKAVTDALRNVHEALRPDQRRHMADLLSHWPRAAHGCGGGWGGFARSHGCGGEGWGRGSRWAGGYGGGAVHL
ncbi:MAG: Spy/CpxP family protein refolding chaperone [Myxococcaceae bacterium]